MKHLILSRRRFLKRSTTAAFSAGMLGSGLLPAPFSRAQGASGDVRVAVVGVGSNVKIGGKGKADLRDFRKIPGVRMVALCDVDRAHLDPEVARWKKENENLKAYVDVRALLDDKEIDVVSVTTPNHWHALVTIWACQAGKDVFVQKPASHNIFEGRKMVEAARKYKRIVQCPSGSRSPAGIREAIDFARAGHLGQILYAHGLNYKPRTSIGKVPGPQPIPKTLDYDLWSGPAPLQPLQREYLHYDWHWDWHYGNGDLGNMGIHYLDGCRIAAGQNQLPERVLSVGGRFAYDDDGQTPNTHVVFLDYHPVPIIFEVRGLPKDKSFLNSAWDRNARTTMDALCGVQIGLLVHCQDGYLANNKAFDRQGKLIREFKPTTPDLKTNFIEAVRNRRPDHLQADIEQGHLSAALVHMANICHRLGHTASPEEIQERSRGRKEWSEACQRFAEHLAANGVDLKKSPATLGPLLSMNPQTEQFTGEFHEDANRLATREYRKPFVVPETV